MKHPLYKQIGGVVVVRSTGVCGVAYVLLILAAALLVMMAISNTSLWDKRFSAGEFFFIVIAASTLGTAVYQTINRLINLYTPLFIFSKSRLYIRGSGLRRGYRPGEIKCKQIVATPLWAQKFIPTDTDPQGKKSVTVFPSDVSLLSSGKYYSMMKALGWFRKETL